MWADLYKEVYRGKTYAKIGERYYSKHAIDYMTSESMREVLNIPKGQELRGVPSIVIEEAIRHGSKSSVVRNGEERIIHTLGDIKVITSVDSKIVITLRKESVK